MLSYFNFGYPFIGAGACGWIVVTADHEGHRFHPAGVRLLANCRVVLGN